MIRLRRRPPVTSRSVPARIDAPVIEAIEGFEHGLVRTATEPGTRIRVIALEGEFDMANVGELDRAIEEGLGAGARDFVVDLSEVDFLDATTVHALLRGWKQSARRNGHFVLVNPPEPIWRVFVMIGLSRTFTTFVSRQEALRQLVRGAA